MASDGGESTGKSDANPAHANTSTFQRTISGLVSDTVGNPVFRSRDVSGGRSPPPHSNRLPNHQHRHRPATTTPSHRRADNLALVPGNNFCVFTQCAHRKDVVWNCEKLVLALKRRSTPPDDLWTGPSCFNLDKKTPRIKEKLDALKRQKIELYPNPECRGTPVQYPASPRPATENLNMLMGLLIPHLNKRERRYAP